MSDIAITTSKSSRRSTKPSTHEEVSNKDQPNTNTLSLVFDNKSAQDLKGWKDYISPKTRRNIEVTTQRVEKLSQKAGQANPTNEELNQEQQKYSKIAGSLNKLKRKNDSKLCQMVQVLYLKIDVLGEVHDARVKDLQRQIDEHINKATEAIQLNHKTPGTPWLEWLKRLKALQASLEDENKTFARSFEPCMELLGIIGAGREE